MAIQGFFTGDVKIRDLNGVLKAVDGIVEVATDAGTVTSVGLTVGSAGTDVNVANSPITTSGSITLNLPTASATNRGLLSSADWTTFNNKQAAGNYVTLDTYQTITASKTFSVGFNLASVGGTNQPTFFENTNNLHSGSVGSNIFGFNTDNNIYFGKGSDNGGIISWNNSEVRYYTLPNANGTIALVGGSGVGTVTSIATTGPITGGTITTTGTIGITQATTSTDGYLSSTDWTTFNSKQGTITLTTTGSSGAATLIGTTLNIPNYGSALTGYVPYTGATGNVDLGEYGLKSGYIAFDLTPTNTPTTQGTMSWNADKESLDLIMNGVTGSLMQDSFFNVKNQTGSSIPKGTVVRAAGTVGASGRILIAPFLADGTYDSKFCIGITAETIANGEDGKVTAFGAIRQIDTSAFPNGTVLYASPTTAGAFTSTEPSNPNNIVTVAIVVYSDNNNGEIFVRPTFIPSQADLIKSLGFTPVTNARTLTINGTTYDLSANRTWSVGTVTSIATTGPLTGGTITGSGTIGITQATTSTDGYLSSTDWNTFNSKQAALTFSAPLINTSGTISIPAATSSVNGYLSSADWDTFNNKQAALSGTGFVKISGTTISYDNSTYYLASNPSSFITLTALSATAPLSYSNTTGVFSISQATTSTDGYLSSTDWNTFNNKQAAGNYITALTGEATASGPGSASVTLSTSAVTGKLLTGLNLAGGGTIAATDSILQAFGKVQNQISGLAGGVTYQGTWNASTNTPTLTSSVGTKGYYYIVDVSGSTNLNGITDWKIGDWAIFNGSTWDKVDNTDAVSSVNGFTGAVSLTTSNIAEGTNLYYLDSRARLALSFTAGSGAYDNTTGVITIPTNTSQLTNGANFITLSSLSASSPLAYNSGTGAFSIQVATGSQNGYLSSTDWTTFNSKQPAGNYVTTDTTQTITALKTFTAKVVINTGGTDDQLQLVGTAPSVRLTNAATGATINGFIAMSGGANNYIQGSVSGDMTIGNQNNGKILFGFGSGTATQKMSLDSSGNAVLSGGLTLGSTLSNGTYTYTLPGATGTLALVGGAGVGTVTSIATTGPITGGTITSTGTIGITQSSGSTDGYLSSTDWTTFNNKQNALTNPVTGTGTNNYIPKFTTTGSTIGNSAITDDGTTVSLLSRALSGTSATFSGAGVDVFSSSGIGTSAVSGLFRVVTGGTASGIAIGQSNSTRYTSIWANEHIIYNDDFFMRTNGAFPLVLGTNNTARLTIASTGAATFSSSVIAYGPANDWGLSIWGSTTTGQSYGGIVRGGTNSSDVAFRVNNAANNTTFLTVQGNGNVGIGSTLPVKTLEVRGTLAISNSAASYWYMDRDDSDGRFKILTDADAERFSIATSGAATFSSSVSLTSGYLSVDGFGNKDTNYITMRSGFAPSDSGGIGFKAIDHSGSGTDGLACYGHDGISFYTAQSERLRITSGGVLKIGNGGTADDGLNPGYKNVAISFNNAQNRGEIQAVQQGLLVYPLVLNGAGGNVGIGTYNPLGPLEVRAANRLVSNDGIIQVNSSSSVGIDLGGSLTFGGIWTSGSTTPTEWAQISGRKENATDSNFAGYLSFATRANGGVNTERMRITSGGNVEIATGSIKTGEPDTGYGRAAIKIGARNTGEAFNSGGHLPVNIDGTIYYINLYSSLP